MNPVLVRELEIGVGMPKICVPITDTTERAIVESARIMHNFPVDLVEWRADWFEGIDDWESVRSVLLQLRSVLANIPLLFTFRT